MSSSAPSYPLILTRKPLYDCPASFRPPAVCVGVVLPPLSAHAALIELNTRIVSLTHSLTHPLTPFLLIVYRARVSPFEQFQAIIETYQGESSSGDETIQRFEDVRLRGRKRTQSMMG